MEKLVNEQIIFGMPEDLRESYDHELAMKDEGIREGYKSGREDGIKQGTSQTKAEIINNMLELNMSKEEISKIMKISLKELNEIIESK